MRSAEESADFLLEFRKEKGQKRMDEKTEQISRETILPQVFARLAKNAWSYTEKRITYQGMTNGLYDVMGVVYRSNALSQDEIARELAIDKSQCSKLIVKGEKLHLLQRKKDEKDGRRLIVSLTEEGKKAIEQLLSTVAQWQNALFECLNPQQKEDFLSTLQKLSQASENLI